MATPTQTRSLLAKQTLPPTTFPVLLGLVCLIGGGSLAFTAVQQMASLGANAPYLQSLVALNQPASDDLNVLGPAAKSVDNLTFFLAIAWMAVAAVMLIVAAGYFLTSAHLRHPDAARRVAGVGLWMALAAALVSLIPFDAGWADAGMGSGSPYESVRSGVIALAGLLLLQISAPQWRESVREAFRD